MRYLFLSLQAFTTAKLFSAVNPEKDPQARGDPFKTLFIARLSYDVKEADLEREFGRFGPIERVCLCAHILP